MRSTVGLKSKPKGGRLQCRIEGRRHRRRSPAGGIDGGDDALPAERDEAAIGGTDVEADERVAALVTPVIFGAVVTAAKVVGGERGQLAGVGEPADVAEVGSDGEADQLLGDRTDIAEAAPAWRSTAYSVVRSVGGVGLADAGLCADVEQGELPAGC